MTKELVAEARGRPKEERLVVEEAREILEQIEGKQSNIVFHEKTIVDEKHQLNLLKKKLSLLETNQYLIKKPEWGTGLKIEYVPLPKEEKKA